MTRTDADFFRRILSVNDTVLAPMAGVTDVAFRQMCLRRGALLMYTEMVSCKGMCYGNENTSFLLKLGEDETSTGVQIFGCDEHFMSEAVKRYLNQSDFAFIDINMGCPVKKVAGNGEGSALLKDTKKLFSVAKAVVEASEKPVSAKIRTGWDGEHINVTDNIKALEDAGISAVAVHGRTREMFYAGKADRDLIASAVDAVDIPVIANGDVDSYGSYLDMKEHTKADGIMIGRGAMGNPFIFEEIGMRKQGLEWKQPGPREKLAEALTHLKLMTDCKDEHTACCEFRKQLCWYTKGMEGGAEIRKIATSLSTFAEFENYIGDLLERYPSEAGS